MAETAFELKTEGDVTKVILDDVTYSVNEEGNAVDDEGNVIKTKDEIEALKSKQEKPKKPSDKEGGEEDPPKPDAFTDGQKVDIDGVVYTINKDGAAVDDKGAVVYSKEQLGELQVVEGSEGDSRDGSQKDENSLNITELQKVINISPLGEDGKPAQYENTKEGLTRYITDVRDVGYRQGADEGVRNLLNTYPVLNDVIAHVRLHGTMDNFSQVPDYSKVTINKEDEDQMRDIISTARRLKGESPAVTETFLKYVKDSDAMETVAKEELDFIKKHFDGVRQQRDAQISQQQEEEENELKQYWGVNIDDDGRIVPLNLPNSVHDKVLRTGVVEVGGTKYKIPENIRINDGGKVSYKTRQDFFDYMFRPVEIRLSNGQLVNITRHEYDTYLEDAQRTVDKDVFEAFRRFTKYDDSQLVMDKVNSKIADTVPRFTTKPKGDSGKKGAVKIII